jgi:hypothetical protein
MGRPYKDVLKDLVDLKDSWMKVEEWICNEARKDGDIRG